MDSTTVTAPQYSFESTIKKVREARGQTCKAVVLKKENEEEEDKEEEEKENWQIDMGLALKLVWWDCLP